MQHTRLTGWNLFISKFINFFNGYKHKNNEMDKYDLYETKEFHLVFGSKFQQEIIYNFFQMSSNHICSVLVLARGPLK